MKQINRRKTDLMSYVWEPHKNMRLQEVIKAGSSYTFKQRNDTFVRNRQDKDICA